MSDPATSDAERKMQFLYALRSKGVMDSRVLTAMEKVDRGRFVTGHFADRAYDDMPLPISCGQTISQRCRAPWPKTLRPTLFCALQTRVFAST